MKETINTLALFIHGPQGCGKTRNAAAFCTFSKKRYAVDYNPRMPQNSYKDAIVFWHEPLPGLIPFATTMQIADL